MVFLACQGAFTAKLIEQSKMPLVLFAKLNFPVMTKYFLPALFLFLFFGAEAQNKFETATFKVYGNCGMCEKRIENALFISGIKEADWSEETQMLTVTFKPSKISLQAIHEKVAAVGHDTDLVKAKDDVYQNLHGCCKYERPKM
jgi:periplasmic mercuric ion binding protein